MTPTPQLAQKLAAVLEIEPDVRQGATCPSCHTPRAGVVDDGQIPGGDWQCGRCGQRWDAARLASVTAYKTWVVEYEARRRTLRATEK